MYRLQTVGGNTALALLLTVSSNLLGIFTMPFLLCQLLGSSGSAVTLKPGPLLLNLLKTILVPLLFGATIRATSPGQYHCCAVFNPNVLLLFCAAESAEEHVSSCAVWSNHSCHFTRSVPLPCCLRSPCTAAVLCY